MYLSQRDKCDLLKLCLFLVAVFVMLVFALGYQECVVLIENNYYSGTVINDQCGCVTNKKWW